MTDRYRPSLFRLSPLTTQLSSGYLLIFIFVFISVTSSLASAASSKHDVNFQAGVIERTDDISWNIGGYLCEACDYVDVLSELEWQDIESIIFDAKISVMERKSDWIITANAGYGLITDGQVQDSDYATSGRKDEFSRSVNSSAGDDLWYFYLEAGREYRRKNMIITPYLGYSYDQINLQMTDGFQVVNIDPDTGAVGYTGPFGGLNSSYDATWDGFLVGASLKSRYGNLLISGSAEYHWFDFTAEADWNLRPDFEHPVSFKHTASGEGYLLQASIDYLLAKNFAAGLSYQLRNFVTEEGRDTTFFSNGDYGQTPLNEVVWETNKLGFAFKYFY